MTTAQPTPTIEQLAVEERGYAAGDSFIIRASGHPTQAARSWTRAELTSAVNVANGAERIGFREAHVYYRTPEGHLVEQDFDHLPTKGLS